mgnify:CR=1 FL=1
MIYNARQNNNIYFLITRRDTRLRMNLRGLNTEAC